MPLDDAPELRLKDRIFRGLFTLVGREPQTFSLLHRLLLVAAQMVGWDGEKSTWVKTDKGGRLELAPITVGVIAPVEATTLLSENFEGAFNWQISGAGADWVGERRAEAAFLGDYGLYLKTRTTGATEGDAVTAVRQIAYYGKRQVEFLLRFSPHNLDGAKYISFALTVFDEDGQWSAHIRRDSDAGVWQYKDSAGAYQTIPGLPTEIAEDSWYLLGLEVDGETHRYGKVRFLAETIDLAPAGLWRQFAVAKDRRLALDVVITKGPIEIPELYVDDILVRGMV